LNTKNGFDRNTKAMVWAQCKEESARFQRLEESFAYTAQRLLEVSSRVKNMNIASSLINQGHEAIANFMYESRMGNGALETGDGWKYRGRGLIMLTGRSNYCTASKSIKIDLLNQPDLAKEPDVASKIAINYFSSRPWLMRASKAGDVLEVSSWINLGRYTKDQKDLPLGLIDRKAFFEEGLKIFKS